VSDRIQPRTLKGFRDFLPDTMAAREHLMAVARRVYRSYGYRPMDTPALEYAEILLGKGGEESDRQLYAFEDAGGREIALRFDLTVPLARFAAQHSGSLGLPFKRYQMGSVWRAEKPQRGRFREFMQCDFDTIGSEGLAPDIETGLVIYDLFAGLGFERFTTRVNNRVVLSGMLDLVGLADQTAEVLRAVDKLPKVGPNGVEEELGATVGATPGQVERILAFCSISGTPGRVIAGLRDEVGESPAASAGVDHLEALFAGFEAAGCDMDRFALDVSVARGLDYYTGVVFETFLDDLPEIGSCCSGGRYDDLASLYSKQRLPGVGASLGVDRLLAAMDELGVAGTNVAAADAIVTMFDGDRVQDYVAMASTLRAAGISTEVYPDARKLGAQLKYADGRGHRLAVIAGGLEFAQGTVRIKDLASGEEEEVPIADLVVTCRRMLAVL
jgi:histidyl-tRNA synthetase